MQGSRCGRAWRATVLQSCRTNPSTTHWQCRAVRRATTAGLTRPAYLYCADMARHVMYILCLNRTVSAQNNTANSSVYTRLCPQLANCHPARHNLAERHHPTGVGHATFRQAAHQTRKHTHTKKKKVLRLDWIHQSDRSHRLLIPITNQSVRMAQNSDE